MKRVFSQIVVGVIVTVIGGLLTQALTSGGKGGRHGGHGFAMSARR